MVVRLDALESWPLLVARSDTLKNWPSLIVKLDTLEIYPLLVVVRHTGELTFTAVRLGTLESWPFLVVRLDTLESWPLLVVRWHTGELTFTCSKVRHTGELTFTGSKVRHTGELIFTGSKVRHTESWPLLVVRLNTLHRLFRLFDMSWMLCRTFLLAKCFQPVDVRAGNGLCCVWIWFLWWLQRSFHELVSLCLLLCRCLYVRPHCAF